MIVCAFFRNEFVGFSTNQLGRTVAYGKWFVELGIREQCHGPNQSRSVARIKKNRGVLPVNAWSLTYKWLVQKSNTDESQWTFEITYRLECCTKLTFRGRVVQITHEDCAVLTRRIMWDWLAMHSGGSRSDRRLSNRCRVFGWFGPFNFSFLKQQIRRKRW